MATDPEKSASGKSLSEEFERIVREFRIRRKEVWDWGDRLAWDQIAMFAENNAEAIVSALKKAQEADRLAVERIPRTCPPEPDRIMYSWHILSERTVVSLAQWIGGNWYCAGEAGAISPEVMWLRGWRWRKRIDLCALSMIENAQAS